MAEEPIPGPMTGYFRVELAVQDNVTTLWQAVSDGVVVGYFDAKAVPFTLPDVYEMRVTDDQLIAAMPMG